MNSLQGYASGPRYDASVKALHAVVHLMERSWAVEPARRPNIREATTEPAHLLDELEATAAASGRDASSTESGPAPSSVGAMCDCSGFNVCALELRVHPPVTLLT
jgi:hypothetical protein